MSWLKRVTGIQELIDEQRITNNLVGEIMKLQLAKPKPEGPVTKS